MIKAYGYDRVSTARQASRADLDQRYREAMRKLCQRREWAMHPRIFTDPGLTGRNAERPGLQEAIERAIKHKGVLVFYDLSRFSRSLEDAVAINRQLRAGGAALCSCTEPIDTTDDSPAGELVFHVIASCAQFVSRLNGAKVKLKNAQTVALLGHRTNGPQPAGVRLGENGVRVACEAELATIEKATAYLALYGPSEAARRLDEEGVPTIGKLRNWSHGLRWTRGMVQHYHSKRAGQSQ
jgi:DNA invertase Pin-like site-specific DNA recombinase